MDSHHGYPFMTPEERELNLLYDEAIKVTGGFDVPKFPDEFVMEGQIVPVVFAHSEYMREIGSKYCKLAIETYNKQHNTNFQFTELIKWNAAALLNYITFKAIDQNSFGRPMKTFQAEIYDHPGKDELDQVEVEFCRLAPPDL
ncbi:unnamed protein product [Cuscuta epithymum]|uniref:Uncharacterized protein n=1 Tax=Cuscuta epithymum TaxID=186058 RepID=A0AAV0D3M3_9ASTE|nr:unnamed protein product [Cuscuta epithymum]